METMIINVVRNGEMYTYRRKLKPIEQENAQYYDRIIKLNINGICDSIIAEVLEIGYEKVRGMRRSLGLAGVRGPGRPTKAECFDMREKAKKLLG